MKYISDKIKCEIIRASPGTVILLEAPVGSGKTTFCIQELWCHCRIQHKNMLLLVNRSALRGQLKIAIFRELHMTETVQMDDKLLEVDGLTVTSYQYIQELMRHNPYSKTVKIGAVAAGKFDYVVADEIHYLLIDSVFSSSTGSFRFFPSTFPKAVRIYISATLKPVRNLLLNIEEVKDLYEVYESEFDRKYLPYRFQQSGVRAMLAYGNECAVQRNVLDIHTVEADYSYFTPVFYEEKKAVSQIIKEKTEGGDTGKWLVFVSSKDEGMKIKAQLIDAGITAAFVTADGDTRTVMEVDDKHERDSILEKKKFQVQVLLATSAIDNGVSIVDRKVKHLIITGYEVIQAVQQAGRIRVKGCTQKVELYICRHTAEYFNRCQYQLREKLRACMIFSDESGQSEQKQMSYLISIHDDSLLSVIRKGADGKWHVNPLARPALDYFMGELEENKTLVRDNPDGFVFKVLSWFGLPYRVEDDMLEQRKKLAEADMRNLLSKGLGVSMSGACWDNFREKLRAVYEKSTGEKLCSGRSDRLIGVAKIKGILGIYGYALKSERKAYTITEEKR